MVRRGIFTEQNSYHSRVGGTFLLGNCLRISIQGALNRRVPQQFLLHLDVSAGTSMIRKASVLVGYWATVPMVVDLRYRRPSCVVS